MRKSEQFYLMSDDRLIEISRPYSRKIAEAIAADRARREGKTWHIVDSLGVEVMSFAPSERSSP